ncbi:MAG: glycosyltransferase family 39 protein [candidate division Zixibacteria bacterium]|nr:glycosyltransferase family 39 protein [candidate division Zixibacteria bacterium]
MAPALVLLAALAVRLLYLLMFSRLPDWDLLTIDNWYHHNWALSIIGGNIAGDTTYFRGPLYIWCLAAVYALFGVSLWAARIFGILIGVASVGMTYLTGRRLAGERVALIAAVIQIFCPIMMSFEAELLIDPLFTLLVQISFHLFLTWNDERRWPSFLAFSIVLGLSAITRPTILGFVPLVGLLIIWQFRNSRAELARHLSAGILGLSLTVGVVFVRNIVVAGDPVLVASQGGINFYISNNSSADGLSAAMPQPLGYNWRIEDITYLAQKDRGRMLKPGEVSAYWNSQAINWITAHPTEFIRLYVKRIWFSIANIEISNNRLIPPLYNRIRLLGYNPVRFGILLGLAVIGWIVAWRTIAAARIGLWFVVVFTVMNALFFYNSRFRLPLIPIYIIMAAVAIHELWQRRGRLKPRYALIAGLAAMALSFSPVYHLPPGVSTQDLLSKGLAKYNEGDFHAALVHYQQAADLDSVFPGTNLNVGAAFLRLGRTDSAEWYLQKEVTRYPDCVDALANLASIGLLRGDTRRAQEYARAGLAVQPYDPTANALLIRALANDSTATLEDVWNQARAAVAISGNMTWICNEAGTALEARGDYAHAELMYQTGAEATDPSIETDDQMFESTYERTLTRRRQEKAKANFALGSLAGRKGEYALAVILSRKAIELDSLQASPYVNLISAYLRLGETKSADSALTVARRRFPDNRMIQRLADGTLRQQ